jgi:histidine ammonia-lyase
VPLARVHACVRAAVPTLDADRPPSRDIAAIAALIARGEIDRACAMKVN